MEYTECSAGEQNEADGLKTAGSAVVPASERNYKDTVFRMLFREKEALLSLYNAVNRTNFNDVEELEITTLENAVYMGMKNDVSCMFAFELSLYEHQSTVNPNIPLRDLFYVASQLQKMVTKKNLYSSRKTQIPAPRFAVFYNGNTAMPERQEYRLSELFQKQVERPELELIVTIYNINPGMNEELMEACRQLREYMIFTTKIREYRKTMKLEVAVDKAVTDCIREGILAEFLRAQRAEVMAMSILEYDQEEHMEQLKDEWREDGFLEGRAEGRAEERERMLSLLELMGQNNELHLVSKLQDKEYLEQMYEKYQV